MSDDRQAVAVGFLEGGYHRVLVWNLARNVRIDMLGSFDATISRLIFSRDGALLAAGSTDGVVGIWDLKTQEPLPVPPSSAVYHVEFTPDNKRLLFDTGTDLSVWDIREGRLLPVEHGGQGLSVFGIAPDAKYLTVCWGEQDLTLLDPRSLLMKGTLHGHRGATQNIAFSPDGKLMASASDDQTARIWDLARKWRPASSADSENGLQASSFPPTARISC
jgi:hypothetical protein